MQPGGDLVVGAAQTPVAIARDGRGSAAGAAPALEEGAMRYDLKRGSERFGGFAMILGWLLFGGSLPYHAWGTPWVVPAVLLWLGPPSLAVAVVIDDRRLHARLDAERAESAHQPREANRALAEARRRWRKRP
jgi:hypothetical protein